jgi:hypothetical protein
VTSTVGGPRRGKNKKGSCSGQTEDWHEGDDMRVAKSFGSVTYLSSLDSEAKGHGRNVHDETDYINEFKNSKFSLNTSTIKLIQALFKLNADNSY